MGCNLEKVNHSRMFMTSEKTVVKKKAPPPKKIMEKLYFFLDHLGHYSLADCNKNPSYHLRNVCCRFLTA